jgi:hypothetical protein
MAEEKFSGPFDSSSVAFAPSDSLKVTSFQLFSTPYGSIAVIIVRGLQDDRVRT